MTVIQKRKTNVPLQTLRRLAPRGIAVVSEHAARNPAIALFTQTLVPVAEGFVQAYDRARATGPNERREQQEASVAVRELDATIRAWLGHLARDIPGFKADSFARGTAVPDDRVADGRRLLELVSSYNETAEAPLSYVNELVGAIQPGLETAEREIAEAQRLLAQHQELRAGVRDLAGALQRELVALRRTLRAVLGSSHRDYRSLLVTVTSSGEPGEDTVEVEADDPESEADAATLPPSEGDGEEEEVSAAE